MLIFNLLTRFTIARFILHMIGTFMLLFVLPGPTYKLAPSPQIWKGITFSTTF
ncbi:MAG: hypothetical protein AAF961_04310 [Planctomycetota bacterium]